MFNYLFSFCLILQGKLYDFWEPLSEDALSSGQEEQQEQRRPQAQEEEEALQGQRRRPPRGEGPAAGDPEEGLAQGQPEEEAEAAEEEMSDDGSGDETVMEDEEVTVMEEQPPEREEPNGEKNLSEEDDSGVDQTVESPAGGQEGALLGEDEEADKRTRLETDKGLMEERELETAGKEEPERRGEMPVMEDKELAMEEDSPREDGATPKEAPVKASVLAMEENSASAQGQLVREVQLEETQMEVELPGEQEQVMEVRVEAGEQQEALGSSREEVQMEVEEVEMKETDSEAPEQAGPHAEEPMTEGYTGAGEGAIGGKMHQVTDKDTTRAGGDGDVSQLKSLLDSQS